jgi:ArsR family transcriptional regulator, arsenate/arsenite/antimonite-responsive transcriptional repressor / arsenate reductase (thioredoxin)
MRAIGLCVTFDGQACPDFGDKAVTASWSLPDPAKFTGTGVPGSTRSARGRRGL